MQAYMVVGNDGVGGIEDLEAFEVRRNVESIQVNKLSRYFGLQRE